MPPAFLLAISTSFALDRPASSADLNLQGHDEAIGRAAATGDLNDDGNLDMVFGAPREDGGGFINNGAVYSIFGPIDDTITSGYASSKITGEAHAAEVGSALHASGDYDGDGADDLLIGASAHDAGGADAGRVYLFYSPVAGTTNTGAADATFTGSSASAKMGWSLASMDVDDDGNDDVITGAPYYGGSNGRVYVWEGGSLAGSYAATSADRIFTGKTGSGEEAGYSLTVGSFDGLDTLVVGGPSRDLGGADVDNGVLYFLAQDFTFPTTGALDTKADWAITGGSGVSRLGEQVASGFDSDFAGDEELLACDDNGECLFFYLPDTETSSSGYDAIFRYSGSYEPNLRVTAAGEVNGDVYDDFLLSDPGSDYNSDSESEGSAYLFYGSSIWYSGNVDLDSDADVVFEGFDDGDEFGGALASGDVNNDGKSDILVSAPLADIGAGSNQGAGYLFYGPFDPISGTFNLVDADTVIDGDDAGDWGGYAVAGIGDINCDGVDDFAAGGIFSDEVATSTGAVYIFYGPTPGSDYLAWLNVFLVAPDADVIFYGDAASDFAGNNIAGVGDLNDDDCDDFAIAAAGNDGAAADAGAVYLFYGTGSLGVALDSSDADATFRGASAGDAFGTGLRGGGDFDDDGIDDLVVGAPYNDGVATNAGAVYVFFGGSGGAAWSGTVAATSADCKYRGVAAGDWAGWSLATAFDFDFDYAHDLAIGAPGVDDTLGSNTGLVALFYSTACSGTASLSTADASVRGKYATEQFGFAIAAGDVNDDNYRDLIVGAPYRSDEGSVYWIPGRASFTGFYRAPANGVHLCNDSAARFGWSVDAGDVDGVGGAEIVAGAPWLTISATQRGQGYVWYGTTIAGWEDDGLCHAPSTAEVKMTGEDAYDFAGWSVATVGDLNQDGEQDIGIGAYGSERGLTNQGAAYVVLSSH